MIVVLDCLKDYAVLFLCVALGFFVICLTKTFMIVLFGATKLVFSFSSLIISFVYFLIYKPILMDAVKKQQLMKRRNGDDRKCYSCFNEQKSNPRAKKRK